MHKFEQRLTIILIVLIVFSAVLAGCQSQSEATVEPSFGEENELDPTSEPEVPDSPSEDNSEEAVVVEKAAEVNQCLVCHTDQARLEETADPVVDLESESSGEG